MLWCRKCCPLMVNNMAYEEREKAMLHYSTKRKKAESDTYEAQDSTRQALWDCLECILGLPRCRLQNTD